MLLEWEPPTTENLVSAWERGLDELWQDDSETMLVDFEDSKEVLGKEKQQGSASSLESDSRDENEEDEVESMNLELEKYSQAELLGKERTVDEMDQETSVDAPLACCMDLTSVSTQHGEVRSLEISIEYDL